MFFLDVHNIMFCEPHPKFLYHVRNSWNHQKTMKSQTFIISQGPTFSLENFIQFRSTTHKFKYRMPEVQSLSPSKDILLDTSQESNMTTSIMLESKSNISQTLFHSKHHNSSNLAFSFWIHLLYLKEETFQLKASATTKAFHGWYYNKMLEYFIDSFHKCCSKFNLFSENWYFRLLLSINNSNLAL